jgi:hypothetical protein
MSPLTVLGWFVRAPLVLAGAGVAAIVVWSHVVVLPTFTDPKHRDFWNDVTAYHLRAEGHKSLDQLYAAYDPDFVRLCAVHHAFYQAAVPSEKSGLAFWVGYAMEGATGDPPQRSPYWLREGQAMFLVLVVPLLMFVHAATRNLAWAVCGSERAAELFAERYEAPFWRRAVGTAVVVPVVVALAAVGVAQGLTPDLKRAGFTLTDLTVIAVVQSYFGGALVRFVRGVIDAGFLAAGIDPESVYWDDLVAVAVTAPALVLLYGNPPVGILGDLAAGVGPPVVLKVWRRIRIARARGALDAEIVPDGAEAVSRNWLPAVGAAAVGFMLLSCGGCGSFVLRNQQSMPTAVTAAELEARPLPPIVNWVEVEDGFLFWPLLAAVPDSNRPGEVLRYAVPLVSRETRDAWVAELAKGPEARYHTTRVRPVVSFPKREVERLFPGATQGNFDAERPWVEYRVRGRTRQLSGQSDAERKAVKAGDAAEAAVVVIEDGDRPGIQPGMLTSFILVGLVALIPLPLRWLVSALRPRAVRRDERRRSRRNDD